MGGNSFNPQEYAVGHPDPTLTAPEGTAGGGASCAGIMGAQHSLSLDTGWAIRALRNGYRVRRAGWNGKGMWLQYIEPGHYTVNGSVLTAPDVSVMLPWIGMRTAGGGFVPWLCSQTDLLADDWELVSADAAQSAA